MDPMIHFWKRKNHIPHAHSSYRHSGSRRRNLKVSGKKVYHSADRTGDARCPYNACEIARISFSNPKKIPRRPHYYRAAALVCEYFADFVRARCSSSNKRK